MLETLARKWGDCKAKSFLLIDLLHAAGIAAYPAVILADPAGRVADFPSPDDFNHLIVAVAAEGVAAVTDAAADARQCPQPRSCGGADPTAPDQQRRGQRAKSPFDRRLPVR